MNKHDYLFYEDEKKSKRTIIIIACVLSFLFIVWTVMYILSLTIPPTEKQIELGFSQPTVKETIPQVITLAIVLGIIIFLFVYRFKATKFKTFTAISESEIVIKKSDCALNKYEPRNIKGFNAFHRDNYAMIELSFSDNTKVLITTRKPSELKTLIEYLVNRNQEQKEKN